MTHQKTTEGREMKHTKVQVSVLQICQSEL